MRSTHSDESVRQMMDEATTCLHCGVRLRYLDKQKRRNRGYCSLRCYYDRPPKLAYLCLKHDGEPREVLLRLLNEHQSTDVVAALAGANRQALHNWMRRYHIYREVRYFALGVTG